MTVSVISPGWKPEKQQRPKTDPLDTILKGLQAVQAIYGIRVDSAKLDEYQRNRDLADQTTPLKLEQAKADIDKTRAEADRARNPSATGQGTTRDVKYIMDGKTFFKTLGPGERLPEGATPYEEPKEPRPRREGEGGKFTSQDVKFWDDSLKEFRNNKKVSQAEEYYGAAATVDKLLDLKSQQADAQVATLMNKLARDPTAPSGEQLKNAGASQNVINYFSSLKTKYLDEQSPTLTDLDRNNIRQIAEITKDLARRDFIKQADVWASDKSRVSDMTDKEILNRYIRPDETLQAWRDAAGEMASQYAATTPKPAGPAVFFSPQGRAFQSQEMRRQTVNRSWFGGDAQAAPAPQSQAGFDPDAFLRGR